MTGPKPDQGAKPQLSPLVLAFLIGLSIPIIIQLGPLRLSVYRLALIAMFIPCLAGWLSGLGGRIRMADICVVLICVWSAISFSVVHGVASSIESIGINTIETLGPYLLARCYIRTPEQFYQMVKVLFTIVVVLIPFGIVEMITGKNVLLRTIGAFLPAMWDVPHEKRWGLDRAQGPFDHPILWGVFCASILGLSFYVLGHGRTLWGRGRKATVIGLAAIMSLSSGPMSALAAQGLIIGWERLTLGIKGRWLMFSGLFGVFYVIIDILSNRSPLVVLISYLAMNPQTAYGRLLIWHWGTKNIYDNPIFGIGANDWERDFFMTDSVDMFWILPAMRHGIPVWILFFSLFFLVVVAVGRRKGLTGRMADYRMGYMTGMIGLFVCGWSVHFWDAILVLFMFLLGCGAFFLDYEESKDISAKAPKRQDPAPRARPLIGSLRDRDERT